MIIYFDTNIIRNLSERRVDSAEHDILTIRMNIRNKKTVIAPSFEVLAKLLISPDLSKSDRLKNAQFYEDLVDKI